MKILALVTDAFGGYGGIAQYNRDLLTALAGMGQQNRLIVLSRTGGSYSGDLPNNLVQEASIHNEIIYSFKSLWTLLTKGPFDMIYCGHIFMTPLAVVLSLLFRIPFWVCIYGIDAWQKPSRLVEWSIRIASLVVSISRHTRRKFLSWSDVDPHRVRVLPCTVDKKFTPGPKPADLIKKYGLEGKKVLLIISRLSSDEKYKGHDKIIEIMPALIKKYPDLVYVITGEGGDRERLQKLAEKYGMSEKVIFTGKIADEILPDIYRMADVFVMPSTGEGFGVVFLEAVACGLQVIGGNQDGSTDALLDGEGGWIVDPESLDEIKKVIIETLDHSKVRTAKANRFYKQNFNDLVSQLCDKFRECSHETP